MVCLINVKPKMPLPHLKLPELQYASVGQSCTAAFLLFYWLFICKRE